MILNKYEQLTIDLIEAYSEALKVKTNDDGGSANLDSTFLILKGLNEKKVLKSISNAGLYCGGKSHWIGTGYLISTGGGQGNNRTVIRNRFAEILREKGYDVLHFDKMD